jgi:ribosomal protein L7/L12
MEYKINLIARRLGIEDPGDSNPVLRELWKGNKINAIKIYREQTGVGLREAKDVIDALERGEIVTLERSNGTA